MANYAEAVLSASAVVLLLTSIPAAFDETVPEATMTLQATSCSDGETRLLPVSYPLALLYYFPLLVALILLAIPVIRFLRYAKHLVLIVIM